MVVCLSRFNKFRRSHKLFLEAKKHHHEKSRRISRSCQMGFCKTNCTPQINSLSLWRQYEKTKAAVAQEDLPPDVDPKGIFVNNELSLDDIDVYGFDFDYTLALYNKHLHQLIYDLAIQILIEQSKYPRELSNLRFNPDFAIRGLHYDVHKGMIMKVDAFHKIQPGTVFRGHSPVSEEEIRKFYGGLHIPLDLGTSLYGYTRMEGAHFRELTDMFSLTETCLLADISEYFLQNGLQYTPDYLFDDVRGATEFVHSAGLMHSTVKKDFSLYVDRDPGLTKMLRQLQSQDRNVFLITNSDFSYVDAGMNHLIGEDWLEYFNFIITKARKPKFFIENSRPFRNYDLVGKRVGWDVVTDLTKGKVYCEGNIDQFKYLTRWESGNVLYFGDHVYSDLADPAVRHGWRTGAIIPELEGEIQVLNSLQYKRAAKWLQALKILISNLQEASVPDSKYIVSEWKRELSDLRVLTKEVYNARFGSIFRTYTAPSYFARRLQRFADIYTSSVCNLNRYALDHTFYHYRTPLPHEVDFNANYRVRAPNDMLLYKLLPNLENES